MSRHGDRLPPVPAMALGPLVLWNKAVLHCRINRNARFPELVVGTAVNGGMGWVDWGLWC